MRVHRVFGYDLPLLHYPKELRGTAATFNQRLNLVGAASGARHEVP